MSVLRRIRRGARDHPGTPILVVLTVVMFAAGFRRGGVETGFMAGVGALILFGSMWLVGCVHRGGGQS